MIIHNSHYNDECKFLCVEFSNKEDGDEYYRYIEMSNDDILFYSPDLIFEIDINNLNDKEIIEILNQYLLENNLPDRMYL